MEFNAVQALIIHKLEKELNPQLSYHNVNHTKGVIARARELAIAENVSEDVQGILLTAALFHDTGFLETYDGHEEASCKLAREILPGYDYTQAEIDSICQLIMATRVPQKPQTHLEKIICDADLYYLGTDQYVPIAEGLFHELQHIGKALNRKEWMALQAEFLKGHSYFTATAREMLAANQQQNLLQLPAMAAPDTNELKHDGYNISDIILIVLGVLTAGFALQGFLVPHGFFDGGITGISLLLHETFHFPLAVVIIVANLPLIIMSRYVITKHFALKTLLCIIMLGLCLHYIPYPSVLPLLPQQPEDKLLISVFGGFFLGIGIGLTMRAGCAVDGIEVLALYTWRKTSFTISEVIMALNIIIFSIAAFKFGIPTALYSILTYFTASKTVDYVVEGIEAYTGVTIISGKSEIIKDRLVNELGRGITVYKGERGYLPGKFEIHEDCDIIFTIITRLELRKLKNLVSEVDHKAFVFASTIKETSGGIIKRRHMH